MINIINEINDVLEGNGLDANPFRNGSDISYRNIEVFMCGNARALDIDIIEGLTAINARVYFDIIKDNKKEKLDQLISKFNSKYNYRFSIDKDGYLVLTLLLKHIPMSKALVELEKFIMLCLSNPSEIKKVVNC